MFICRQQPKGFSKRQRLLTEPPCKYMKTIHLRYIYVPQQGASSAHTTAPARPDGAMPDANGAHTGQMDQVNSAPTNHTTNDTSQHIKLVILHSHPSIRNNNDSGWKQVTRINCPGISLVKASAGMNVRLDVEQSPMFFSVFDSWYSGFSPFLQPLLILHCMLT